MKPFSSDVFAGWLVEVKSGFEQIRQSVLRKYFRASMRDVVSLASAGLAIQSVVLRPKWLASVVQLEGFFELRKFFFRGGRFFHERRMAKDIDLEMQGRTPRKRKTFSEVTVAGVYICANLATLM